MMKNRLLQFGIIFIIILSGCSQSTELIRQDPPSTNNDVNYSIIYYIHADSDYLYHKSNGVAVKNNSKVLDTAFKVAETANAGEVFIFYQRSERKFLGIFPRKSSRLYHYQNGRQINRIKYRHSDKNEPFLTTESDLLNQLRHPALSKANQNYFLFFGHEIPLETDQVYHQSLPGIDVNVESFAQGIQRFLLNENDRFSLVVLSTCNNGTPQMAELLMPFTDSMLASPQNLHLSHIDTDKLALLENAPDISTVELSHLIAEQTFQRLAATVRTTITLTYYNFEDVQSYIDSLTSLILTKNSSMPTVQFQDNVDCSPLFFPNSALFGEGTATWHKPAQFGRQTGESTHSGWGCKPIAINPE